MKFHGTGSPLSSDGFANALAIMGIDAPTLWAVLSVETRGFGFLRSRRPVILFERHVFHRLTGGRFDVSHPDLSNPMPGGYRGGAAEYGRLNGASTLDADAALQSASWGIGQLMGFNYEHVGCASVEQMVAAMREDEDKQLWATATFIQDCGTNAALQRHDWQDFARSYNGPDFGREGYDAKLAAAYARYRQWLPSFDVRSLQVALLYLGFSPGPIDGVPGPRTVAAIMAFQRKRKFKVTGRLDAQMTDALLYAAFAA